MPAASGAEVVAVFGPTASGKTEVAEHVADALGTEVVSADALQVYRELPILTNQPARATRLVAFRSISDEMSVGEYATLAHAAVDELVLANGRAVLCGGTGLYLRAALADMRIPPAPGRVERERVEQAYDRSPQNAYARLGELDPRAAARIHVNDRRRVVRALELAETGHSLTPANDELWSSGMRHPSLVVGLDLPWPLLEARIRDRAEMMIERGAIDEARLALAGDISRTARQALGLQELAELPREEALDRLVLRTRRYAAYQRKWMRRIPGLVLVDATRSPEVVATEIVALTRAG